MAVHDKKYAIKNASGNLLFLFHSSILIAVCMCVCVYVCVFVNVCVE